MIRKLFEKRKMRPVAFGEVTTNWTDRTATIFSVVFYQNEYGKRKWVASGGDLLRKFSCSQYYAACEIWRHTGLLPKWAKDILAEKLIQ